MSPVFSRKLSRACWLMCLYYSLRYKLVTHVTETKSRKVHPFFIGQSVIWHTVWHTYIVPGFFFHHDDSTLTISGLSHFRTLYETCDPQQSHKAYSSTDMRRTGLFQSCQYDDGNKKRHGSLLIVRWTKKNMGEFIAWISLFLTFSLSCSR